jgi:hypothetical protein
VELAELKEDRPRLYEQLVESGELEQSLAGPPPPWLGRWARIFGLTALSFGMLTIILIIYSMVFLYR